MKNFRAAVRLLIFVIVVLGTSALVNGQATRTWVSGVGADDNPCSRTAPCKTFAGAQSKTATNGEINCLDPGGYGTVTIIKSLTIDCEDTQGSILALTPSNGVVINITDATDTRKAVMLRGISINGANSGLNGVRIVRANDVALDNVVIFGFAQHGVSIESTTGALKLVVDRCLIRRNLGHGLNSVPAASTADIAISNSTLSTMGGNGLNLSNSTIVAISDSHITANATGILASNAQIFASRTTIYKNTTGVQAAGTATVRLFGNTITGNGTGLTGATITAVTGTNTLLGNGVDGAPTNFVQPLGL